MLPEESGRGFFGMQRFMLEELAEYAKGTWPDVHEFADMVEEGDGDVAGMWLVGAIEQCHPFQAWQESGAGVVRYERGAADCRVVP